MGPPCPLFVVSVPVRTGVPYLSSALESVLLQKGLACIALLDASGDAAVEGLAEDYGDIIAYKRHTKEDLGQSAAINEGWANLSAAYYGWLNADDFIFPGALELVHQEFLNHPQADVIYGDCVLVDGDENLIGYFPSISDSIAGIDASNIICQPGCFVRRRAVELVGGVDVNRTFTMDWDLWLRLRDAGCQFHQIQAPLAVVRMLPGSKTLAGGWRRIREIDDVLAARVGKIERLRAHIGHFSSHARYSNRRGMLRLLKAVSGLLSLLAPAAREQSPLYGFGRSTNRVDGIAHVLLPVLFPCELTLRFVLDRPVQALTGLLRDQALSLVGDGTKTVWTSALGRLGVGTLDLALTADKPGWRLRRVEVSPSPFLGQRMSLT